MPPIERERDTARERGRGRTGDLSVIAADPRFHEWGRRKRESREQHAFFEVNELPHGVGEQRMSERDFRNLDRCKKKLVLCRFEIDRDDVASFSNTIPASKQAPNQGEPHSFQFTKTNQEIPKQWFNLIDLDQLHKRINNDVELTDVFGHLTAVQPIEDVTVQSSRIAKKRNLNLQDIRGETIRITLWGEAATTFEDSGIKSLPPPIFLAVTSLKVKEYRGNPVLGSTGSTVCIFNPEIPQLTQYKQKFKDLKSPVQTLRTSAEMYADRAVSPNFESKTIDELLLLDPALHKNVSFECKATVIGFDLSRGWWYKSCPFCHKAVKKTSGAFQCNEHGSFNRLPEPWFKINLIVEDSTNQHNFLMLGRNAEKILHVSCHTLVIEDGYDDPFMVPPPLKKLVGETKRFLLSFGNQNSDFRKTDFIIYGLLQDQLPLNTAIASIDPQTPTATAGKQIITEATPAPVTPSQRPDHHPQSVVPLKTSKRPLFIDQADKPDSKKTRTEQIEVTNSARIAREFHKLVVPKIEPADKEPIAALKTKSQTKKTKDSAQDVRPPKK
nr:uncharacterized protein LOC103413668 [Malus domestica]